MYHVINNAKILITMCSGAMNIGGCTDTHILQVGSAQNPLLRIPYRNNTQNYKITDESPWHEGKVQKLVSPPQTRWYSLKN